MLALSKALQKGGGRIKIRFYSVRYTPSRSISALFTEQVDANMLLSQQSNLLIQAAKSVDQAVIRVKILKHW